MSILILVIHVCQELSPSDCCLLEQQRGGNFVDEGRGCCA